MNAIVEQMKSEIESLIKERDEFKASYYSAEKCASDLSRGCAKLQSQLTEFRAARYAYASEFSLDKAGQPDVGSIHQNIRALKANHKKVMEAAKLALDASLQVYATCDWYGDDGREAIGALSEAINTLRQAGVQ